MILKYKQTDREKEHKFIIYSLNNNAIFCEGMTGGNAFKTGIALNFHDGENILLYGSMKDNIKEQPLKEMTSVKGLYTANEYMNASRINIFNKNNDSIGVIKRQKVEAKILWAEKYVINYIDNEYEGFFVAKSFNGRYYFIKDNFGNTVIAIKQSLNAVNYYFSYKIYVENDYYAKLAAIFLSVADNHAYGANWVYSGINIQSETTLVAQPKEIKDKFDGDFIKRIKSMR